jgi:hypothetical protein
MPFVSQSCAWSTIRIPCARVDHILRALNSYTFELRIYNSSTGLLHCFLDFFPVHTAPLRLLHTDIRIPASWQQPTYEDSCFTPCAIHENLQRKPIPSNPGLVTTAASPWDRHLRSTFLAQPCSPTLAPDRCLSYAVSAEFPSFPPTSCPVPLLFRCKYMRQHKATRNTTKPQEAIPTNKTGLPLPLLPVLRSFVRRSVVFIEKTLVLVSSRNKCAIAKI